MSATAILAEERLTEQVFLSDVATHGMLVLRNDGLYRHLKFARPENSWCMWFELVTWPSSLVIRGDMGTWHFSRIEDMFQFFRRPKFGINPSYWAEKCESVDAVSGPARQFSAPAFRRSVLSSLDNYDLPAKAKKSVIAALEEDVFKEDHEYPARAALNDFRCDDFTFVDAWEIGGQDWSYRFLWCLYAIVWGIEKYDADHV